VLEPTEDRTVALSVVDVTALTAPGVVLPGNGPAAPALRRIADAVDAACRSEGFFAVIGHGVDPDLLDAVFATADSLFALDRATKEGLQVACPPGVQRGYSGFGAEAQARAGGDTTPPDLSESFAIGSPPLPGNGPFGCDNVWPPVRGFEAAWTEYRAVMTELARRLLAACALALCDDAAAFDALVACPIGSTRANHYPALDAAVPDGQWRGGAHTDYGTLTVLATDGTPGLEIRSELGEWRPVTVPPHCFVVNVGDLLALRSGGRWRSTWHRVTTPPGGPPYPARTSIAHFQFPDHDAVFELGSGEPVTAGAYLTERLARLVDADAAPHMAMTSKDHA
jgi:isopenicillin N synthase-like dioxygenase